MIHKVLLLSKKIDVTSFIEPFSEFIAKRAEQTINDVVVAVSPAAWPEEQGFTHNAVPLSLGFRQFSALQEFMKELEPNVRKGVSLLDSKDKSIDQVLDSVGLKVFNLEG